MNVTISKKATVCRFIRDQDWSPINNRPRPQAFKDNNGLSVWDKDLLDQEAVPLDELRIVDLQGTGQAHHAVGDYFRLAEEAARCKGGTTKILIERRTDDKRVPEPWRKWNYAHIEMHVLSGSVEALKQFRHLLTLRANTLFMKSPDKFH